MISCTFFNGTNWGRNASFNDELEVLCQSGTLVFKAFK